MPIFADLRGLLNRDSFVQSYTQEVLRISVAESIVVTVDASNLELAHDAWLGQYLGRRQGQMQLSRELYLEIIRALCFSLSRSEIVEIESWVRLRGSRSVTQRLLVGFPDQMTTLQFCCRHWIAIKSRLENVTVHDLESKLQSHEFSTACVEIVKQPSLALAFDQFFAIGKTVAN